MDPEMKSLLTTLLERMERIEAKLDGRIAAQPNLDLTEYEKLTAEVARLGGRIDQLSMDVALSRRA